MQKYYIEYTDLFCGALNYSFVTRFIISANTPRGAVHKIARYLGLSFRKYYDDVYHSSTKLSGLVIYDYDDEAHNDFYYDPIEL